MLPFRKSVYMPLYQISGIIVFISESYASWSHPSNKLQFPLDRGKEGGHDSEPKHINNPCLVRWMHRPASQTLLFCQTFTVAGWLDPAMVGRQERGGWRLVGRLLLLELQSSVFPKLWHRHPPGRDGRTFSQLRQRIGSRSPVANMFSLRCLCAAARLVRSPFVF